MVCGFCSTGCGLKVHLRDGAAVGLSPETEYPVNLGMACPKGWEALKVLQADDRAAAPLLRENGKLRPVDWDTALRAFCWRMKAIQEKHGPHSVAFLSTGQIATEEMALLGSLAKFGMGMLHGDGNTRQCMATAVVGLQASVWLRRPALYLSGPGRIGRDRARRAQSVHRPSDPVGTHLPESAQPADRRRRSAEDRNRDGRHAAPAAAAKVRPGVFLRSGEHPHQRGLDRPPLYRRHTEGFDDFAQFVAQFTPERVAEPGIDAATSNWTARLIHEGKRVSFWWTMGVNQSYEGVRTAQAIINLALMTGNIGRPGTGANSITGQCNAMGSRLFSNTTNLLGGHDFANAPTRQKIAGDPGIDAAHPHAKQLGLSRNHRRHLQRKDQGSVGDRHQSGPFLDQPATCSRHARSARLPRRAGHVRLDRDGPRGRSGPAGRGLGRERRNVHQLRTALRADQKSGQSAGQALADFSIFQLSPTTGDAATMFRAVDRSGRDISDHQGNLSRAAVRHNGHCRLRNAGRLRRHPVAVGGRIPAARATSSTV